MNNTPPPRLVPDRPSDAAWKQAFAEVSKTPLNDIKGDLFAAIESRAREIDAAAPPAEAPGEVPEGMALVPSYRGYAHLGIGAYLLDHTKEGEIPELVISMATDEEKAGRVVGDERDNPPGHEIPPEKMAVRLRFANVAGLDALENQLRHLRNVHFPAAAPYTTDGTVEVCGGCNNAESCE